MKNDIKRRIVVYFCSHSFSSRKVIFVVHTENQSIDQLSDHSQRTSDRKNEVSRLDET